MTEGPRSPSSVSIDGTGESISRRAFGRTIGTAAIGGAVQTLSPPGAIARPDDVVQSSSPTSPRSVGELTYLGASELVARMRSKKLSARDVMAAHLKQIERVNPKVNAIVTLVAERAMVDAAKADELAARGGPLGVLHGLPVAHKDLVNTAGIRTTFGSPFFRDNVPTRDALLITRIREAGALTVGKTNTPELGAGSQTFNTVFGATRNPYDLARTCGGSSGGAAVALACGMVPIADGSDTGGSLRNPAAFCNVVGFRPSPGRVTRDAQSWSPLSVSGPMARSVADVALFLSVIAGPDPRSPLVIQEDGSRFAGPLGRSFKGVRVAWWRGLGGIPFEPDVRQVVDANRRSFEDLGCIVEEAEPDFTGVDRAFPTLQVRRQPPALRGDGARAAGLGEGHHQVRGRRGRKADRRGRRRRPGASVPDVRPEPRILSEQYEYFVLPVTQVVPFDVNLPYPIQIAGTPMATYIDWMRSCWYVTFMANPAISVPAGFTASGLPVGIQIVGRHRDDWSVLQLAHAFEQATRHGARRPVVVGSSAE